MARPLKLPPGYTCRPIDFDAMQRELAAFEAKYGVPSAWMDEAFRGSTVETEDEHTWAMLYTELVAMGRV